ncbi:MAG: N-acetyltransferase [Alphaproteobacteria bacterium]|nr:N-acetyltransferase [Alphaproteobacteria bacterium]
MQIIAQTDDHAAAIERLLDLTFGPDRHHKTVYRLREGVAPAPGLSFVIENDNGLAATLRFWPVTLPGGGAALLLGPIAVRPDLSGKGYGRALMRHGIDEARAQGWPAILLVGDEAYYGKLGFSRTAAEKLQLPGPVERARFLALELVAGALDGAEGMVGRAEPDAATQRKAGR